MKRPKFGLESAHHTVYDSDHLDAQHHPLEGEECAIIIDNRPSKIAKAYAERMLEEGAVLTILARKFNDASHFKKSVGADSAGRLSSITSRRYHLVVNCIVSKNPRTGRSPLKKTDYRRIQTLADVNHSPGMTTEFLRLGKEKASPTLVLYVLS